MRSWYQNAWGLVSHPYAFFEEAIGKGNPFPATAFFAGVFVIIYGGWWLISGGQHLASDSKSIVSLFLSVLTYPVSVITIFSICRLLVRDTQLRSFFAVWGFSYLPTFLFFVTDITAHGLAKFPWFANILHYRVSILILWAFLLLMFLWKLLFLAISLRLAGNLNLGQIILALVVLALAMGLYWGVTFNLGWLKIPFI
jgi:hypothetical protein